MGVKIETNFVIGRTKTIDELFEEGFQAVFIGVGAEQSCHCDIRIFVKKIISFKL